MLKKIFFAMVAATILIATMSVVPIQQANTSPPAKIVKAVHLADDTAGNAAGWNPNELITAFVITESAVTANSVVVLTFDYPTAATSSTTCSVSGINPGVSFGVTCSVAPDDTGSLNYVIINP